MTARFACGLLILRHVLLSSESHDGKHHCLIHHTDTPPARPIMGSTVDLAMDPKAAQSEKISVCHVNDGEGAHQNKCCCDKNNGNESDDEGGRNGDRNDDDAGQDLIPLPPSRSTDNADGFDSHCTLDPECALYGQTAVDLDAQDGIDDDGFGKHHRSGEDHDYDDEREESITRHIRTIRNSRKLKFTTCPDFELRVANTTETAGIVISADTPGNPNRFSPGIRSAGSSDRPITGRWCRKSGRPVRERWLLQGEEAGDLEDWPCVDMVCSQRFELELER